MDPRVMAERTARTQKRMFEAATQFANVLELGAELEALTKAQHRDPQIGLLFQREALAALLESAAAKIQAGPGQLLTDKTILEKEIDKLSQWLLEHHPEHIGKGDPATGESAVDVAIRLLAAVPSTPAKPVVEASLPSKKPPKGKTR